jgi:hypothetical protein
VPAASPQLHERIGHMMEGTIPSARRGRGGPRFAESWQGAYRHQLRQRELWAQEVAAQHPDGVRNWNDQPVGRIVGGSNGDTVTTDPGPTNGPGLSAMGTAPGFPSVADDIRTLSGLLDFD